MLIVKKVDFMVFIAHAVNYTAQTNKKSKKLDIIASAETLQIILSEDALPSQAPEPVVIGVGS